MAGSKKRFSLIVTVLLVIAVALSACGGKNNESGNGNKPGTDTGNVKKVTVNMGFWGTAQDLKIYQDAAKAISGEYPEIDLKIKQYPSSEQFWNTLPGEIAAGVAPDLIAVSNEGAYEYIDKGLFAPLDDLIGKAGVDLGRFTPSALNIWKVNDKQYGIPASSMPAMFLINEKLWKDANLGDYPKTWDDVKAAATKLNSDKSHGIIINIDAYHITNYVKSFGGGWGNGKTINSPENVQALEFIIDMFKDGLAVTPKSLGFGWDGEVFSNEKGAMTTGGYWYKPYLKDANPDLKFAAVPVPKGTVEGSTMISNAYVVLKDSKNQEAALKAANYLTNDTVQTQFLDIGYNTAVASLSKQYFEKNPEFKDIEPALAYSTDFGYPADTKRFIDELVKQVENRVLGGSNKTAKEILDSIQEQFK
ncbi:ABC transporter substrate-binding protein [Paenibacillus sp. GCM10012307]|uniref:Sugar ABC transporter substrate-binding protein n=1 Tax=Paenibacillus roseus TaxID=2798579 RepID=A0A934MLT1_9BACL|nr:sugar ABC transporter substrate-binding protein [Paenibacillus roseus]MBJ6362545.1 sugar ABC transporter substrate-binding protein [Paenibacillus roseus]